MHFIDPFIPATSPRSRLSATLSRLHRHLEANHERDTLAMKAFEDWEARRLRNDETILQQLDSLNQELSDLSAGSGRTPVLSLVTESADDISDAAAAPEAEEPGSANDDEYGIISSPDAPWYRA